MIPGFTLQNHSGTKKPGINLCITYIKRIRVKYAGDPVTGSP